MYSQFLSLLGSSHPQQNGILDASHGILTVVGRSQDPTAFSGYVNEEPVPGGVGLILIGKADISNTGFLGLESVLGLQEFRTSFSYCAFLNNGIAIQNVSGPFQQFSHSSLP